MGMGTSDFIKAPHIQVGIYFKDKKYATRFKTKKEAIEWRKRKEENYGKYNAKEK